MAANLKIQIELDQTSIRDAIIKHITDLHPEFSGRMSTVEFVIKSEEKGDQRDYWTENTLDKAIVSMK